jgi:hypothetical protein
VVYDTAVQRWGWLSSTVVLQLGCTFRWPSTRGAVRRRTVGRVLVGWIGSSYTVVGESSLAMNGQVGDGGAQRLLRRGRHVGAEVDPEDGECGEAAQCLQHLVRQVAPAEVEGGECGKVAHCASALS